MGVIKVGIKNIKSVWEGDVCRGDHVLVSLIVCDSLHALPHTTGGVVNIAVFQFSAWVLFAALIDFSRAQRAS